MYSPLTNFYQSKLRRHINERLYGTPVTEVQIGDKTYVAIAKTKAFFGKTYQRYQILGVEQVSLEMLQAVRSHLKKTFPDGIFFQLGIIDPLALFALGADIDPLAIKNQREGIASDMQKIGYHKSFRENMPLATVYYDLEQDDITANRSKSAKAHLRKGQRAEFEFGTVQPGEEEEFYQARLAVSGHKGFSIIRPDAYKALLAYLREHQKGDAFVIRKDGHMVS